jgi:type I site-specific restriction-modification system R (restriction) subunit
VTRFAESVVEEAALDWLRGLGWQVADGPEIAPGELAAERSDYGQVVLERRLSDALARLNPTLVSGKPGERLGLLPRAQEHILAQRDGKDRLLQAVLELSQAFGLAVPHEEALRIRDYVSFFQAVRASLIKRAPEEARTDAELNLAVRQIVSRAVASDGVVDIFASCRARHASGLSRPRSRHRPRPGSATPRSAGHGAGARARSVRIRDVDARRSRDRHRLLGWIHR